MVLEKVSGSYRDPAGNVYLTEDNKVYRTINALRAGDFEKMKLDGIIEDSVKAGYLVSTKEVYDESLLHKLNASYLLEHEKIPYISYPYEWSFIQLKEAALLHLKFHQFLLERNYTLIDATAYNVQFIGHKPVFIDVLSIIHYQEGEIWVGYQQFLEQFLNPLLLTALKGINFNEWYRGSLEGIPTADLLAMLSVKQKLNWRVFLFLNLFQKTANEVISNPERILKKAKTCQKKIPKKSLLSMLKQFQTWIEKLEPAKSTTVWDEYADINTYVEHERKNKSEFIRDFVARNNLKSIIDLGCNTGEYSRAALNGGADYVVGFDFDRNALTKAYQRAKNDNAPYLPLWLDASNPSPSQGWLESERSGFSKRFHADGLIALAFEHHLAITKNIPLEQVVRWMTSIAEQGIIEFVPKADPTVKQMLSTRDDIFPDYTQSKFEEALSSFASVINKVKISDSGRMLYEYKISK